MPGGWLCSKTAPVNSAQPTRLTCHKTHTIGLCAVGKDPWGSLRYIRGETYWLSTLRHAHKAALASSPASLFLYFPGPY